MPRVQPELLSDGDFPVEFGRYTLLGLLGEGGMARVFRAELQGPEGFRKAAAVKIIRDSVAGRSEGLRRALINEARLGGLLHHPNVVETYEYGEVDGLPYIAMEQVRGVGLDSILWHEKRLPGPLALEIAAQICGGLDHAHDTEDGGVPALLIHRDLKPSNVLISRDGLAKVMDFGIAKAAASSGTTTQTGMTKGTPSYMSPEQVQGEPLDRRSDLFALGAILFELVTGDRFFAADSIMAILVSVLRVEERLQAEGVLDKADDALPGIAPILFRCLRADRELRYASAAELEADLRSLQRAAEPPPPLKQWVRELADRHGLMKAEPATASLGSRGAARPTTPAAARALTPAPATPAGAAAAAAAPAPAVTTPDPPATAPSPAPATGPAFVLGAAHDASPATRVMPGYPRAAAAGAAALDEPRPAAAPAEPVTGTLWRPTRKRRGPLGTLGLSVAAGALIALVIVGGWSLGRRSGSGGDAGGRSTGAAALPALSSPPASPEDPSGPQLRSPQAVSEQIASTERGEGAQDVAPQGSGSGSVAGARTGSPGSRPKARPEPSGTHKPSLLGKPAPSASRSGSAASPNTTITTTPLDARFRISQVRAHVEERTADGVQVRFEAVVSGSEEDLTVSVSFNPPRARWVTRELRQSPDGVWRVRVSFPNQSLGTAYYYLTAKESGGKKRVASWGDADAPLRMVVK